MVRFRAPLQLPCCVSKDLPFAQKALEGTEALSARVGIPGNFGEDGVTIADGPMAGLLARAIVVIGADGNVTYGVVPIAQNPSLAAAA